MGRRFHQSEINEHEEKIHHDLSVVEAILKDDKALISKYPNMYKIVNKRAKYLYRFIEFSKSKMISGMSARRQFDPFKKPDAEGYFIEPRIKNLFFFASTRYLARKFKGDHTTWNRNINIFVTLGLVNRINTYSIHGKTGRRSIRIRKQMEKALGFVKKRHSFKQVRPVNFYAIPMYTDLQLAYTESIAKRLIESNFRANGFSKIYLIKVFGQEFANKVFPDERYITKGSDYVTRQITKFILTDIKAHGYTTKDRILTQVQLDTDEVKTTEYGFHKDNKRAILGREFDRSISGICDMYGLQYRKVNKELKDRFGLKSYETIIYKDAPEE